jgi:replication factor A1
MGIEEIVEEIRKRTGLSEEIIRSRIQRKIRELTGLVSEEGAAHIVANEFGVRLIKGVEKARLQIKNLIPGMRSATVAGRVIQIWQPREFKREKIEGKVGSFLIGDESGKVRVVIWDSRVAMLEDGSIREGAIVRISNARVKDGMFGGEIHLTSRSKIEIEPGDIKEEEIPKFEQIFKKAERAKICDLVEGKYEIRGTIVQVFESDPFFEVCPQCGLRISLVGSSWVCRDHGEVKPSFSMVVSAVIDDGTGTIRCVFFGRRAERLLGMTSEEALKLAEERGDRIYPIKLKLKKILGKEILVAGDVVRNELYDRVELIGRRLILNPKASIEGNLLLKELR